MTSEQINQAHHLEALQSNSSQKKEPINSKPCYICRGEVFWTTFAGFLRCQNCHPQPEGVPGNEPPYINTPLGRQGIFPELSGKEYGFTSLREILIQTGFLKDLPKAKYNAVKFSG